MQRRRFKIILSKLFVHEFHNRICKTEFVVNVNVSITNNDTCTIKKQKAPTEMFVR